MSLANRRMLIRLRNQLWSRSLLIVAVAFSLGLILAAIESR